MAPLALLLINILLWVLIFGLIYIIGVKVIGLLGLAPPAVLIWQLVFLVIIVVALIAFVGGGTHGWRLIH